MNKNTELNSADLKKFIEEFQPNNFKVIKGGIEVRGMNEIHRNLSEAKALIEKMKLKLTIAHNSQMVSYGAFEVNVL